MKNKQYIFEEKLMKLWKKLNINEIFSFSMSYKIPITKFYYLDYEISSAIGMLDISSSEKISIIDKLAELYEYEEGDFSTIVEVAINNGMDVDDSLMLKYCDPTCFIDGMPLLEYLWNQGKTEIVELFIEKHQDKNKILVFDLYYCGIGDNRKLIEFIKAKYIAPIPIKIIKNYTSIELVGENIIAFVFDIEDLVKLKVNGLSIDEFVASNNEFVETFELVSQNPFIDSCDADSDSYCYPSNIVYFTLQINNKIIYRFDLKWFTDDYMGQDFLQRSYRKRNEYIFTYDNQHISKNFFSSYGFEELIKAKLKLSYDHVMKEEDIIKIKELAITYSSLFKDISSLVEDLKKLPNLTKLILTNNDYYDEVEIYNVSKLIELNKLKYIKFYCDSIGTGLVGIEKLAKEGIKVSFDYNSAYSIDTKELKKVFKDANAKLIID